jgi:hypothetical protein
MFTGAHKMQRMALALTFLQRYHKDGNEFLSDTVKGDGTYVLFVNVNQKSNQSSGCTHQEYSVRGNP